MNTILLEEDDVSINACTCAIDTNICVITCVATCMCMYRKIFTAVIQKNTCIGTKGNIFGSILVLRKENDFTESKKRVYQHSIFK